MQMNFTKEFKPSGDYLNGFVRDYSTNKTNSFLEIIPSSTVDKWYPLTNLFNYNSQCSHWASSSEGSKEPKSFLKIKVRRFGMVISHYSLRSHCDNNCTMTSWVFEASRDGKHFDVLSNKTNSSDLNDGATKLYEINPSNKIYNLFRIRQTNKTRIGYVNMRIAKIDLFGLLVTMDRKTCICNKQGISKLCLFVSFIIRNC